MAGTDLWRANLPGFFHWAVWDDEEEEVFYHQGSGETLLLNPLGAFILKIIGSAEISTDKLVQLAANHFKLPIDQALIDCIEMSLRTFAQKGLIQTHARDYPEFQAG
ncbi:MAG: hypothetical protein KDI27_10250 [Gammaproteobacteria bacterium]|nr:hypothetical protein [Gammaproteobacteria bacterium]MCP5417674.1 hypothetical protein [Chromatiaceae bacterium]